jgi:hypothetical protein
MRGSQAKSIARQLGMLGILTIIVAGLTFLFNLFATIGVSVLAGMMAGAARRWNWQVISVSFLAPGVALALGFVMKVPFDLRHCLYLTGMCLGAFWATWLATHLLMSLEAKSDETAEPQTSACLTPPAESPASLMPDAASADAQASGTAMTTGKAEAQLNLDDLQGTWLCEAKRADKPSNRKLFVVDRGKFSLSIVNGSGQPRLVAQGELMLQGEDNDKILLISARSGVESHEARKV